jgi:alanine-glyoxylate transaminase/serine-glyoxylate transaminase/serine-pyruvate transaminase
MWRCGRNRQFRLMIPGPVDVEPEVLAAMGQPISAHYGPEWVEIYEEVVALLREVFQTRGDVLLMPGPGSAGLDAALGSLLPAGGRVLIPTNGFFGERMATIAEANGLEVGRAAFEWGMPLDLTLVEDRLRTKRMDALAVVHHETSTGVLNPLSEIAALARKHGLPLVVDAVSSLGGVELPVDEWAIDLCISVANKCLAAPPGIALLSVSEWAWERIEANPAHRGWYLDLRTWRQYARDWAGWHPYPTTLPTNNILALQVSLRRILEEGLAAYQARHHAAAQRVRDGLRKLGFPLFVEEPLAAPIITAVGPYPGRAVEEFAAFLKSEHGILVGGGMGPLRGRMCRVGHMGRANSEEYIVAFLAGAEDFTSRCVS